MTISKRIKNASKRAFKAYTLFFTLLILTTET